MNNKKPLYKVVTEELKSLGLRKNPSVMEFTVGEWKLEPYPTEGKIDFGGIWVTANLGGAKTLKKYMSKKYRKDCRIFEVEIGDILYQNSYRIKTNKVKLLREVTL